MEFSKIIAITGKPGLYRVLSQTKNGVIVESLIDQKRVPISASNNVSLLENIAIYTEFEEVPLLEVFQKIATKQEGKETISHKADSKELVSYFTDILPDYDTERVYTSNIKKVIQWYNILATSGFDFLATINEEATTDEEE